MPNYNFNKDLDPDQFEDIGCDIVEIRENIILERFRKNNDLGIDGRNISSKGTLIVQCKRIEDINNLLYKLEKEELPKVQKLNPDRYILVLSISPTVTQKSRIMKLFSNYIRFEYDIITEEDLRSYLRKPQYISVREHYKELILTQNIDFNTLINKIGNFNLSTKSIELMKDIKKIKPYFVETKTYKSAYRNLLENHIIFLSGDAGSGKTTNAYMLLQKLLEEKQIEEIYKVDSYDELSSLLVSQKNIGVLYDDFWGSTFSYLKYALNEEKKLEELLQKIEDREDVYFILTTREYVLQRGLSFYKSFRNKNIEKRVLHKNCNYSEVEKTKILFSHAQNSRLDECYLEMIRLYAKNMIQKRNYSPRSIHYFIRNYQDSELTPNEFIHSFLKYLENPTDFLKAIFYKLSEGSQLIAFTLSISDPEMPLEYLKKSFQSIAKKIDNVRPSEFEEYLKELFDFFIIHPYQQLNVIDFTNHSIFDFINNELSKKIVDYKDAFYNGVIYFNQMYNLLTEYSVEKTNQSILTKRLMEEFEDLVITRDEEIFLDADETWKQQKTYAGHKIWKALTIAEKIDDSILKEFLRKQILLLQKSYDQKIHHYEDENFIALPELVKKAEKLGIEFDREEMIENYLNNVNYIFELGYVEYFPKSYQFLLKKKMKLLGKTMKETFIDRLENEFWFLSMDGISFQYDMTLSFLPYILKMLEIPTTDELKKVIDKYDYHQTIKENTKPPLKVSEERKKKTTNVDREILKFGKELSRKNVISKTKWLSLIKDASLNNENKKKIKKSINEAHSIWYFPTETTIEFSNFLLAYYEKKEEKGHPIITTIDIFPHLSDDIAENYGKNTRYFLRQYAYDIVKNNYNAKSEIHLLKKYSIEKETLDILVNSGILYKNNNIICFGNIEFEIYLSIEYLKNEKQTEKIYNDYYQRDGILNRYELEYMEKYNAYSFNKLILLPILNKVIEEGQESFKKEMLSIECNKDEQTISYSKEFFLINDLLESMFGIFPTLDIAEAFEEEQNGIIDCRKYCEENSTSKITKQIDGLLEIYFNLLQDLYLFLNTLKPSENFSASITEENEVIFEKC